VTLEGLQVRAADAGDLDAVRRCARRARRLGLARLELYTNAGMRSNIGIYRHLGFAETGRRVEHGFDRLCMARPVPQRG